MKLLLLTALLIAGVIGVYGTVMAISTYHSLIQEMHNECEEHMDHDGDDTDHGNMTQEADGEMGLNESIGNVINV